MRLATQPLSGGDQAADRVLVVADWKADPHAAVAAFSREYALGASSFALLMPARLHGLDWMGDPYASVPCAQRALEEVSRLCEASGLPVERAEVGDPDVVAAIGDALLSWRADRLLVCARKRHVRWLPFDLAHRARRASGLPVVVVGVPEPRLGAQVHAWTRIRRGHCGVREARAA